MNNEQEKLNGCENCNGCAEEKKTPETIPYIVYESAMARTERTMRKMWAVIILLIVLLVGSNGAWMWYESQFEDVTTTTYEADSTKGGNAIINGTGSVNINGESENHNDQK